jgi:UDP-GlcNAc:undecaprenyl-phosphate GlcNAc-1-phosphate transferase
VPPTFLSIPTSDLLAFSIALISALLLTPQVRHLAFRIGMVDHPSARKLHLQPMPLLGGLAIYLAFVLAIVVSFRVPTTPRILAILAGATLLVVVGFLDDRGLLHNQVKLFAAMPVSALFLMSTGIRTHVFSSLISGAAGLSLDVGFTLFWVVGITAAFSILDHMDGLCAGVAAIASAFFALVASGAHQPMVRTLAISILGAALGFLVYNFNPASIFMGDGGAMLLGFLLAALSLQVRPLASPSPINWIVPLLILGAPIFDTLMVSISRSRRGLLPFATPGKDHSAHRLSNLGLSTRQAVLAMYAVGFLSGDIALFTIRLTTRSAFLLSAILLAVALIFVALLEQVPFDL